MGKNHRRLRMILTVAVLFGAVCVAHPAPAARTQNNSQPSLPTRISPKAQELLDQTIRALGGPAFLNFKTITTTGRVFAFSSGETAAIAPYQSAAEPPDKRRFSYGKSKPVVLINNGDQAWQIDQYGLSPQLPEQAQSWKLANRYSLENLFRLRVREPGVLIQDSGVDMVANQTVDVLDMVDSHDVRMKIYIQRISHLPLRVTYRVRNSKSNDWDDYVDDYGDYQLFQGVNTPMHIARLLNDQRIGEVFRNTVRYNQAVPPNYFLPSH